MLIAPSTVNSRRHTSLGGVATCLAPCMGDLRPVPSCSTTSAPTARGTTSRQIRPCRSGRPCHCRVAEWLPIVFGQGWPTIPLGVVSNEASKSTIDSIPSPLPSSGNTQTRGSRFQAIVTSAKVPRSPSHQGARRLWSPTRRQGNAETSTSKLNHTYEDVTDSQGAEASSQGA